MMIIVFEKNIVENITLSADDKKHAKLPSMQRLIEHVDFQVVSFVTYVWPNSCASIL